MSATRAGTSSRRQRVAGSSRRAVLWTLAFVVLAQLATELLVRARFPELLDIELGPRLEGLKARLASQDHPLLVVALGSSRIQVGFAAARVEEPLARATGRSVVAYDLGVRLGFATTDEIVLRRLLAAGIRPQLAVVEVVSVPLLDPTRRDAALFTSRLSREEMALVDERFPGSASRERWLDWTLERGFPAHRDRVSLQRRFLTGWGDPEFAADGSDRGWRPIPHEILTPEGRARAFARAHEEFGAILATPRTIEGPACEALEALLGLLERERIPAALVVTPEGPEFRSWYAPANLAAIDRYVESLARWHRLPVASARGWVDDESRFQDSHHLDAEGAVVFTDRLERELLRPVLVAGAR